jgi:hypothetical protein
MEPLFGEAAATGPPGREEDPELDAVTDAILAIDPGGQRLGDVLRETYDQLYDGQRTGRYRWEQLRKTEKTHMGTLVEINIHRDFEFGDGLSMDYEIAGADVDCKFSQSIGGWEFPPEAYDGGHLCLVVWADDLTSRWEAGLIRVTAQDSQLGAPNRDMKRKLLSAGQQRIRWLYDHPLLPENLLLHIDDMTRARVFDPAPGRKATGQAKVNMLFRLVQKRLVNRASVVTVARQKDSMKRARDARLHRHLGKEGVVVLGHQDHDPLVAASLGLSVPRKGEFISARVFPAEPGFRGPVAEIEGARWRLADAQDPVVAGPIIPRSRADND